MDVAMRKDMKYVSGVLLSAALLLTACKPDQAVEQSSNFDRNQPAKILTGVLSGAISFAGRAPAPVKIDMSMDPACSMTAGDNYSEQYVVHDGKLANVFVYVKPAAGMVFTTSDQPVVLDQKGCRYTPHVIGVAVGQPVEFRNSDPTMHNVHIMPMIDGNDVMDVTEGPNGQPQWKQFSKPELMVPVRCNNHPWMNAFINVSPTPYFAVSDADGHFEIKGLPPGNYTLGAVHEKLGEQTQTVTLAGPGTVTANFSFSK